MDILEKLFDEKTLKILNEIENKDMVQIRQIAQLTKLPPSTVYRVFKKFESVNLLQKVAIGTTKIYKVNQNSEAYMLLERLIPKRNPLDILVSNIINYPIEEILLIDSNETMSNILIVGNIKNDDVQKVVDEIKKNFNYSIRFLILSKAQYNNLDALNMKPVHKKVLYKNTKEV